MTTIAYRDGIIAADSRETLSTKSGGDRIVNHNCQKLYKVRGSILATYGCSGAGLAFLDWWKRGAKRSKIPHKLSDYDFGILILARSGDLLHYDNTCIAEELDPHSFYAFGSGSKAALGALWAGADAEKAVYSACMVDPWSGTPVVVIKWPSHRARA